MNAELRQRLDAAHQARIGGDYAEAERVYREVLQDAAEPLEEAETRHGLGYALVFTGQFDEGLAELVLAHEQDPDNARIFLDLAKTHLMLGMYDEAKAELRCIVEQFPDTPEAEEASKQLRYFE